MFSLIFSRSRLGCQNHKRLVLRFDYDRCLSDDIAIGLDRFTDGALYPNPANPVVLHVRKLAETGERNRDEIAERVPTPGVLENTDIELFIPHAGLGI
jgi:hypothetical protein